MALDIWAGEQADRLQLEELIGLHDTRGLELCLRDTGETINLALDDDHSPCRAEAMAVEILRLAAIGAAAIRVLDDRTRRLSHFSHVMRELQSRDAELARRLEAASLGRRGVL